MRAGRSGSPGEATVTGCVRTQSDHGSADGTVRAAGRPAASRTRAAGTHPGAVTLALVGSDPATTWMMAVLTPAD